MDGTIAFYLVIALLAIQVTVLTVLIVLWRKFHKLKQLFDNYQVSRHLEKERRSTDAKEDCKNSYIAGRRDSSTLVRSNSHESIVWVPTPSPKRRSQRMDDNHDLNMTELTVVITGETNQGNIGFANKNFVPSPTEDVAIETSTTKSSVTADVQIHKETTGLKVPNVGSQFHGVTAGRTKLTTGSTMQNTTAETKTDVVTATTGTKASSRNNANTADIISADSQHPTSTADPSIQVQQPSDDNAGINNGYHDDGEGLYENQEFVRTVYNNNNNICEEDILDNNNGFSEDPVIESHVTSGVVQPIDEPIYVNRDIINQFRR